MQLDQTIHLTANRIYNVDNEAFRYLCALSKGVEIADNAHIKKEFEQSWQISKTDTNRLVDYVKELSPYLTRNMETLNKARKLISMLVRPLVDVCANLQSNINVLQQRYKELSKMGEYQVQRSKKYVPLVKIEAKEIYEPYTVCANIGCAKFRHFQGYDVKFIEFSTCHEPCVVQNLTFSGKIWFSLQNYRY